MEILLVVSYEVLFYSNRTKRIRTIPVEIRTASNAWNDNMHNARLKRVQKAIQLNPVSRVFVKRHWKNKKLILATHKRRFFHEISQFCVPT